MKRFPVDFSISLYKIGRHIQLKGEKLMENVLFTKQKHSFKKEKIKRVILSKISDISDGNIQTILGAISFDKQYYVKVTRNPKKFLNIVTEENVCRADGFVKSKSVVVYGDCIPGSFEECLGNRKVIQGTLDIASPAAAVKSIINNPNGKETAEYILVIYEPMPSAG